MSQLLARVDGGDTGILNVFALPRFPDIHYFHCLRIVDLLKGTEASTKNIFGRYSSQRMKASVGEGADGIRALGLSEDPVETPTGNASWTFSPTPELMPEVAPLGIARWRHTLTIKWVVQPVLRDGQGMCVWCDGKAGRACPAPGLRWDVTAESCPGSLPVSVLPQDWQEIVALYEKDNSYLGRRSSLGLLMSRAPLGNPAPIVPRHRASRRHRPCGERLGCRCLHGGKTHPTVLGGAGGPGRS